MMNKQPVGAHYGWKDWMIQRVTAVIMLLFSVAVLGFLLINGGVGYGEWKQFFGGELVRVLTLMFLMSVFYHAWIGVRNVLLDYVKPLWVRLTLQVVVVLFLAGCSIWSVSILWGR